MIVRLQETNEQAAGVAGAEQVAPFVPIATVYTKAAPADAPSKAIPLVNAGREQHAFVAHIARNYLLGWFWVDVPMYHVFTGVSPPW